MPGRRFIERVNVLHMPARHHQHMTFHGLAQIHESDHAIVAISGE